jgi:regulator of replication initiation timing
MEVMEIVLLVIGIALLFLGFIIPAKEEKGTRINKELAKAEIKELIDEEMKEIKQQVDDTVEEAVSYAMEKTERSLERISNEKIMAVNEYSDTVLAEIHKNHQEVMFLYDMLNDKHTNLKQTATVVEKKAKEAEAIVNEAFTSLKPEKIEEPVKKEVLPKEPTRTSRTKKETKNKQNNSNANILTLYKQGMDKVQIARELGLGVGEVDLVIGLFKEK